MKSVVLVDDDHDTVEALSEVLEMKDIKVLGKGYDGKEAVEVYKQHNPDVIILDLAMPEYDGFYAIEEIKKINPEAKILVFTASLDKDTNEKLRKANPTKVVYKPYEIDEVVDMINNL